MTKKTWEYMVVCLAEYEEDAVLEAKFDYHGQKGWQLVAVNDTHAYFKRRLPHEGNK